MKASLEAMPQTIETEDISLRLLCDEDASAFYEITNAPEIANIVSFLSYPVDPAFPQEWIAKNNNTDDRLYGIFDGATLVGHMGTHLTPQGKVEIGYWVNTKFTGKGIASKALKGTINALRTTYPHYTIFAKCLPDNPASIRILEKAGFICKDQEAEHSRLMRWGLQEN